MIEAFLCENDFVQPSAEPAAVKTQSVGIASQNSLLRDHHTGFPEQCFECLISNPVADPEDWAADTFFH